MSAWLCSSTNSPGRPHGLRGPKTYPERLILKALVITIICHLYTVYAGLTFLNQADPLAQQLRPRLYVHGRFPMRRSWACRLAALTPRLPGSIGGLGRHLVAVPTPWARQPLAPAADSTP